MNLKAKIIKHKNYLILVMSILITFGVVYIASAVENTYIDLYGDRTRANEADLIKQDENYYLSYKYVKENIDNQIYFDNISKKLVISSDLGLYKIKVDDKKIDVNFEERELENVGLIEKGEIYISVEVLKLAYQIDITVQQNTVYIYSKNNYDAKLKYNNISVYKYSDINSKIVDYVDKKDQIKAIFEKENFVFVKLKDNDVGYVLKNAIIANIENVKNDEVEKERKIYLFADANTDKVNIDLDIDGIVFNMFDVTQANTNIKERSINKKILLDASKKGYKIYSAITNGYNAVGFDKSTTTQILADESKRINLINNLNDKIKEYNLDGVVIDFRKIREKDIENYIQFIKELKAFCKKDVIVNIDSVEYKTYIPVINYTDFSIINAYGQRDLTSTVSGSVSEINWMKDIIEFVANKANNNKIVIAIPAYTILWTEKNSNVIDSEIYNLKACKQYVEKNKLEVKEINGQNYAEYKKGTLTYKMWLEDALSINNRIKIIKEKDILGAAIYKLGYENKEMIDVLKNNY